MDSCRSARFRAFLALTLLAGCRKAPGPERAQDLIALFDEAEVRSDALELPLLLTQPGFKDRAWIDASEHGHALIWSRRREAALRLPFFSNGPKRLLLRARCDASLAPGLPLGVALNGHPLGTWDLTPEERELRIELPAADQIAGDNVLVLGVPRQRDPPKDDPEQLPLAVGISALQVRPPGSSSPPVLQDGGLWLPARSSVAFYLRPAPGSAVEIEAAGRLMVGTDDGSSPTVLGEVVSEKRRLALPVAADGFLRIEMQNPADTSVSVSLARMLSPEIKTAAAAPDASAPRPNIVFFLVDTLRADHLGAYGHQKPTSPRFDAFAREAVLFQDAWAQAPWTRPAVASIFTGLQPGTHGVSGVDRVLSPALPTLAKTLRDAGYHTAAFVANHLVNPRYGFDQGFDTWNDGDPRLQGVDASTLVSHALQWVDHAQQPYFLYVHTLDPHSPYEPSEASWQPFRPSAKASAATPELLLQAHENRISDADMTYLHSAYEGEVRQNDTGFGNLVDGLRARHVLDAALLLFTADHGEEFLDHGGMEHAHTVYQELLHVPLAVRLPGGRRGGEREAAPVEQIDLMPTLLAFARGRAPANLQGRDLSQHWLGLPQSGEAPLRFSETHFGAAQKYAARSGAWKLIVNRDRRALWRAGVPVELYDLRADPGEKEDRAPQKSVIAGYLHRRVNALIALQERLRLRASGERITLSQEDLEQLHALGYVK